ncbi:hypothetical protein ACOME3_003311 [Neoechinorhynchus agilis]
MARFLYSLIGIEMHIGVRSNFKLFSPASCVELKKYSSPNSQVAPLDIGAPGALPLSINKQSVKAAVKLSRILNCHLNTTSFFDRKHYMYHDLPIGYQITQKRKPIAEQGYFDYPAENPKKSLKYKTKRAFISRIQIEQDTATTGDLDDNKELRMVDYNRAGMPLLELVTDCCFRTAEEVRLFVDEMRLALRLAGISRLPCRVDVRYC